MYSSQNSKKVNFNDTGNISFNIEEYDNNDMTVPSNKKKMTYDDILESMCMRVQNGNLCMIKEEFNKLNNSLLKDKSQNTCSNKNQTTCNSKTKSCHLTNDKTINTINNNSYIYNKYFQNHKQNDNSGENTIVDDINMLKEMLHSGQISPQEYNKEVLIKLIEYRNQKLYLHKLNSQKRKLLFSTSNINISRTNRVNPNNLNKLFNFVGPGPLPYPNPNMSDYYPK
jgi:hypothetical protein